MSSTLVICPVEGCGGSWTQGNKWKHETTAKHVTAVRSCLIRSRQSAPATTVVVEPAQASVAAAIDDAASRRPIPSPTKMREENNGENEGGSGGEE